MHWIIDPVTTETTSPSEDQIRTQLDRLLSSPELNQSAKLQEFLSYVVEESLAGRARYIKGVTIAQALYGEDKEFDPESNSIVRVEAGRLRRRLTEYYMKEGRDDPVIIEIPKGGYAPQFSENPQPADAPLAHQISKPGSKGGARNTIWISAVLVASLLVWNWIETRQSQPADTNSATVNGTSQTEAQVMFQQAFVLLMPPDDPARREAALSLLREVKEAKPYNPAGYAGESLAWSVVVLFSKSEDPQRDLSTALELSELALERNANYPLGFAARALSLSLDGRSEEALTSVRRYVALDSPDPLTNNFISLVLLNEGMPEEAIEFLEEALTMNPHEPRTPYLNLLGIAHYATGDYQAAHGMFERNQARNGPRGPHMDVFIAATHRRLGQDLEAEAVLERLKEADASYLSAAWLSRYLKSEAEIQDTLDVISTP